jgi:hypothetical protein
MVKSLIIILTNLGDGKVQAGVRVHERLGEDHRPDVQGLRHPHGHGLGHLCGGGGDEVR